MKDTNLPGLQCDGDTKCCAQEREEIFFPEGQAVVAFPALRLSHVGPSLNSPGMSRKDWLTSNEAIHMPFYGTLNKDEFVSGQHREALACLSERLELLWVAFLGSLGRVAGSILASEAWERERQV